MLESSIPGSKDVHLVPVASSAQINLPHSSHDQKHVLLLDSIEAEVNNIISALANIDDGTLHDQIKLCVLLDQLLEQVMGIGMFLANGLNNVTAQIFMCKQKNPSDITEHGYMHQ